MTSSWSDHGRIILGSCSNRSRIVNVQVADSKVMFKKVKRTEGTLLDLCNHASQERMLIFSVSFQMRSLTQTT